MFPQLFRVLPNIYGYRKFPGLIQLCFFSEHNESTSGPRLRLDRLQSLPTGFRPYFTCAVALAQLFMFIWMCWATTFADIGLSPMVYQRAGELRVGPFRVTSCLFTFRLPLKLMSHLIRQWVFSTRMLITLTAKVKIKYKENEIT